MNGHIFQLHAKRKNKSQFADTMEALRMYASSAFKNDIEYPTPLFTDLKEPRVTELEDPKEEIGTSKVSLFQQTIYNERIKQWIKGERSLKQAIRAIYNIVWG